MARHSIVRCTGFPFDLLARLQRPDTAAAASGVVAVEQELLNLAGTAGWSAAGVEELRSCLVRGAFKLGAAERERPEWVDAITRYRAARRRLDEIAAKEQALAPRVTDLAGVPRLREALAVSNPRILADLDRRGRTAQLTHQVATFLQRVCAKNETLSFFGPINYATLDQSAPDGVALRWQGPAVLSARRAHASSWVVAALARAVAGAEAVRPWLVLRRRNPGVARWSGDPAALPARLLALVDARHTLGALAERIGVAVPELAEAAGALCAAGLASHQFEPPAAHPDPLAYLVNRLAAVPGTAGLAAGLSGLAALRDGFCADDATGKADRQHRFLHAARRIAPDLAPDRDRRGQFYTDRLPLREECAGTVHLRLGGDAVRELRDRVVPALDFLAVLALRRRELARRALARRLGRRTTPLWKLAAKAHDWPQPADDELRALAAAGIPDTRCREVDLAAIPALAELVRGTPLAGTGAVCSIDLLVAARDAAAWSVGHYDVVLGDVHDTVLLTDWALQFHPDAQRVRTERDAAVAGAFGPVPVVTVLAGRQTGIPPLELPGPVVELGGLSRQGSPWLTDLRDLLVHSDGERVRLCSAPLGGEVALHNGELDTLVQTAFAPLRLRAPRFVLGAHTPRLRWGAAVVQRESWTVPCPVLAGLGGAAQPLAARRVWAGHGLPDQVFVHLPGVRKPLFADATSPALVAALARAARRVDAAGQALVSEVLPGPDGLWLTSPQGRHTAELRCLFTRTAEETPAV